MATRAVRGYMDQIGFSAVSLLPELISSELQWVDAKAFLKEWSL